MKLARGRDRALQVTDLVRERLVAQAARAGHGVSIGVRSPVHRRDRQVRVTAPVGVLGHEDDHVRRQTVAQERTSLLVFSAFSVVCMPLPDWDSATCCRPTRLRVTPTWLLTDAWFADCTADWIMLS